MHGDCEIDDWVGCEEFHHVELEAIEVHVYWSWCGGRSVDGGGRRGECETESIGLRAIE